MARARNELEATLEQCPRYGVRNRSAGDFILYRRQAWEEVMVLALENSTIGSQDQSVTLQGFPLSSCRRIASALAEGESTRLM